jgi:hypothetical protein
MVEDAKPPAPPEVELAPLVHPEQAVDAPPRETRDPEIRAENPISKHDLTRLQAPPERAEQRRLARLLAPIRAQGQVADHAGGQRDQRDHPDQREPQADPLCVRLRVCLLVRQTVRHRGGRAVDQGDTTPLPEPAVGGATIGPPGGLPDQADDDCFGQSQAGLAVAAGVRLAGLAPVDGHPDDQPGDGCPARMVGVDDLGKKERESHQGRVDPLMERDAFGEQRLVDHAGIEDVVEGEDLGIAEGFDPLRDPASCSLGHRRPPRRDEARIV